MLVLEISKAILDLWNISHGLSKIKLISLDFVFFLRSFISFFDILYHRLIIHWLRIDNLNNSLIHLIWMINILIKDGLINCIFNICFTNILLFVVVFIMIWLLLSIWNSLTSISLRLFFFLVIYVYLSRRWGSINWYWQLLLLFLASICQESMLFLNRGLLILLLICLLIKHAYLAHFFTFRGLFLLLLFGHLSSLSSIVIIRVLEIVSQLFEGW